MCIIDEIEKQGLPHPIPGYNGKPVLINKSGSFFRRDGYIEHTVNVHLFSYIARKALHTLQPKFSRMVLNIGFVIEGRDDDELPECMLGVAKVIHMDPGERAPIIMYRSNAPSKFTLLDLLSILLPSTAATADVNVV